VYYLKINDCFEDFVMKSIELLKRVMSEKDWTPYRLAKELDIQPSSVYRLLDGHAIMSDYVASQVADLLEVSEMEVIALCNYERSLKESERKYWLKKSQGLVAVACSIFLIFSLNIGANSATLDARASTNSIDSVLMALFLMVILIRITYIMFN